MTVSMEECSLARTESNDYGSVASGDEVPDDTNRETGDTGYSAVEETSLGENELEPEKEKNKVGDETDDDENYSFSAVKATHRRLSKSFKPKGNKNISVLERGNKTCYVCDCGYSSTSKSGSSRHKCLTKENLNFACTECGKKCSNPGSLKRHMVVHKKADEGQKEVSNSLEPPSPFICGECGKTFKTSAAMKGHITKTHASKSQVSQNYDFKFLLLI